ncbi:MAG: response regulator, partial [Polyangiaceae bacterium]
EVAWQLRHLPPEGRFEVVIAEDNAATAAILSSLVTDAAPDAHVQIASDGRMALDLVRRLVPDLVVVDLHLPGLDGIGVCTALRSMGAASQCTVVATSGHAQRHEIETLRRHGFTRFVKKGYELAVLMPGLVGEARRCSTRSLTPRA